MDRAMRDFMVIIRRPLVIADQSRPQAQTSSSTTVIEKEKGIAVNVSMDAKIAEVVPAFARKRRS